MWLLTCVDSTASKITLVMASRAIPSRGDPTVFLTRPVSLTLLILAVIAFAIAVLPTVRRKREAVFEEEV
jgi:TctA family transporter